MTMKKMVFIFVLLTLPLFNEIIAQVADKASLAKGMNFIETGVYSSEDDERILELYKDLRVADVSDGMDMVGLPGTGLVNPEIHASWIDPVDFKHVFRGIAITVRYVPTQRPALPAPGEDFKKWESNFYSAISLQLDLQVSAYLQVPNLYSSFLKSRAWAAAINSIPRMP